MSYGTSIPFIMRKTKLSYDAARTKINELVDQGFINSNSEEIPLQSFKLTFLAISKYGRDLFYPNDKESEFIIRRLLKQKTATKNQLKAMQEQGWMVNVETKKVVF